MSPNKKSEPELSEDLKLSHDILNYLNAAFQGKFAFYNILSQLEHPDYSQDEADQTRQTLDTVNGWLTGVKQGEPFIFTYWTKPQTHESKDMIKLFDALRQDLRAASTQVASIFALDDLSKHPNDTKLLLASFGRSCYSQDNYLRGYVEFSNIFKLEEVKQQYEELLEPVQEEVELVHEMLKMLREGGAQEPSFYDTLVQTTLTLPGVFLSRAHDVLNLLVPITSALSFESIGCPPEEATAWIQAGSNPIEAGYWRSHGMGPKDALAWTGGGIVEPAQAALWKIWGFDPEGAYPWYNEGLPPLLAFRWATAGYSAVDSLQYLQQGVYDPEQLAETEAEPEGEK